jgi:hypothetical protein
MAAFRASRFVWRAISSMIPIREVMSFMAVTACATALPPSAASAAVFSAIVSVVVAFSEVLLIVAPISSMEDDTSSPAAACWLEPMESDCEASLICSAPVDTSPVASRIVSTASKMDERSPVASRIVSPNSSLLFRVASSSLKRAASSLKSPPAKAVTTAVVSLIGFLM